MGKRPVPQEPQETSGMVRIEEIASVFGLSVERCYRLAKEGVIKGRRVKGETAKMYPFVETIKTYIVHLQKKTGGRGRTLDDLNAAKLRESELRQRKLEVQVLLAEGKAFPEEAVSAVMTDMLGAFRTRLRAMPQDIAPKLANLPDEPAVKKVLAEEVDSICLLLSGYNRSDFIARNPQLVEDDDAEEENEVGVKGGDLTGTTANARS